MPMPIPKTHAHAACALMAIACCGGCSESTAPVSQTPDPSSPDESAAGDPPEAGLSDADLCNNFIDPNGVPFATAFFPISDACPSPRERVAPLPSSTITNVTRDRPGEICMSGEVSSGWVNLIMSVDRINDIFSDTSPPETRQPLNTVALGITALRFTLDPAPTHGLHVALSFVVGQDCTASTPDCIRAGFYAMEEERPGVLVNFDQAGPQTIRIADFQRAPWADPTLELDTTKISGVEFELNAGAFDFCIRDFELLDASGSPLAPPPG